MYFDNIKTIEEAKNLFRDLCKKLHPDTSGYDSQNEFVKIAKVLFNGSEAFVYSTCKCFPSSKAELKYGDLIESETVIGYFSADGEEIPYYKPYAEVRIN